MHPLSSPSNRIFRLYLHVSLPGKRYWLSANTAAETPPLPSKSKVRGRSQGDTTANFGQIAPRLTAVTGVAVATGLGSTARSSRLSRSPRIHLALAAGGTVAPGQPAVPRPRRATPNVRATTHAEPSAGAAAWARSVPRARAGRASSPPSRPHRRSGSAPRSAPCRRRSRRTCNPRPQHSGDSAPSHALRPHSWDPTPPRHRRRDSARRPSMPRCEYPGPPPVNHALRAASSMVEPIQASARGSKYPET